ncbi:MAG: hypothetical protein JW808_03660 [Victivallales bacterium]|nr:hypothetical protein [Victivallales bacterium]
MTTDALRDFLLSRGLREASTDEVVSCPLPEPYIDAVPAPGGGYYRTSHEIGLKILLSRGSGDIFEIGHCWRANESGRLHREKFTMLEWYVVGANYLDLITFTREMLLDVSQAVSGASRLSFGDSATDLGAEWLLMTVGEAFDRYSRLKMSDAVSLGVFEEELSFRIEPSLPQEVPVVLIDFPAEFAALSKLSDENPSLCQRWELYIRGVEIANAYTELTDPLEHRQRLAKFADVRKGNSSEEYKENKEFMEAVNRGIPHSAGCALGVDRLNMTLNCESSL